MRSFLYVPIALLTLTPLCLAAQDTATRTVEGRVIDTETGDPLIGVHVYLTRTTIGTTTNQEGRYVLLAIPTGSYRLAASMLGYTVAIKRLPRGNAAAVLDFELTPAVLELEEIEVTATRPDYWYEQLDYFQRLFLGRTPNASKCSLINPEVLHFDYDDDTKHFRAEAQEPLVIENKALGYRLFYHLDTFEARHDQVRYRGALRFEELEPRNRRERRRWGRRREAAYKGSPQHFLSTVMQATVIRDIRRAGFEIHLVPDFMNDPSYTIPLRSPAILKPAADPHSRLLNFADYLQVVYTSDYHPPTHGSVPGGLGAMPIEDYTSWITLNGGPAEVDRYGHFFDPFSVTMYGLWSKERVAEALPRDYAPIALGR